ncbi:hypothetical protein [Thermocatellispora tengchongensis]|uniref:hypothetical protein n=1 Tax=Thermocatellispora tengchongensis TaxID=1073253 RepID=UPI003635AF22
MRIAEPTPTPQDTTPAPGTPRTMRGVREGGDEPEEGGALAWRVAAGGGELAVELFPWFLLRTTGMPVRLLDGLAGEEAGRLTDRVLAAERDIDDARRAFEANARAMREAVVRMEPVRRSRKIARHCLRAVREGVPLGEEEIGLLAQLGQAEWVARWEIAVAAAREAYGHAARAHARALAAARRRVAEAYDDDAVRHAVFVSNPGFHRAAGDGPLPREEDAGADRRSRLLIATVHRYLRRFATRCETVSFFGPTLHARLDPGEPAALLVGEPGPERVVVEASAWLADHLQDVLKRAAAPAGLRVWRSPVFREPPPEQGPAPGLERTLDGRRVRVPEPALRLWRAADGRRTLGELARELGLPVEEAVALARALGPAVIISWHRLPATELRPLTALSRAVRGDTTSGGVSGGVSVGASGGVSGGASGGAAAGAAGAALAALSELRSRYESAPWPVRAAHFEAAQAVVAGLGAQPRQGAGRHYADREIFHEDRSSPYSERVTIGGAALARLRDALSSVLPVCALAALLARQDARDALRAELAGRAAPLARLAVANLRADSPGCGPSPPSCATSWPPTPTAPPPAPARPYASAAVTCRSRPPRCGPRSPRSPPRRTTSTPACPAPT